MTLRALGRVFSVPAAILIAVGIALTGCGSGKKGGRGDGPVKEEQVFSVSQAKAESRDIPAVIQATGSMVADETSDVAPKVAGKIVNIGTDIGRFIKEGAMIAKIDDRDARNRLIEAKAGVKQAEAAVRQAEVRIGLGSGGDFNESAVPEVRAANANVEQARAELRQAEANEKRYRELVESGDVAVVTYEQYKTQRDTAQMRANVAQQQLESAINSARQNNQAIKSAEANLESAKAQVAVAEEALADTVVKAPFSGYVSDRKVAIGEYVSSASVIATIVRTNPLKVQIQVAEADIPYLSIGRNVTIEVEAYKGKRFNGTVKAINPSLDPSSRSATVEARIENNDNILRAGMFATVKINREGGSEGIFIPMAARLADPTTQSYKVFVIQDGVAKLRIVQLGAEEGDFVQILSGINKDETVATSNLEQLYEGAKIQQ